MFKKIGLFCAFAIGVATFTTGAQALTAGSASCTNSSITNVITGSNIACYGSFDGNDTGADVVAYLNNTVNGALSLTGSWGSNNADKSDAGGNGVFTSNPETNDGTLSFDTAMKGIFAVTIKASNSFSLFIFDGGMTGITSFDFTTDGISVNTNGKAQKLSHASYFSFDGKSTVVPLPAALPLLIGGLGVLGVAGWRRKKAA